MVSLGRQQGGKQERKVNASLKARAYIGALMRPFDGSFVVI